MDSTKNLFTNLSMHQSLKSNPMLQGLSKGVSMFPNSADKPKETPTAIGRKGVCSAASSSVIIPEKPKHSCSTSMFTNNNMNTNRSTFFKTAHSTMCIPQQQSSSVIISSPFKHLMVGPKISNQPTPFHGPVNNNSTMTSQSPDQQTPGVDNNANEETNCKILFPSGKGGTPAAEQAGTKSTNNGSAGSTSAPGHRSRKVNLANMDPERLALMKQRRRDRKFQKLQSLSALMRAPDDRHSLGPLTALKREFTPNKILSPNLSPKLSAFSSNPFNRSSLGGSHQLNKLSVNNPWKGENTKKPCSFIHEPSLKNSAIPSQNSSLELPKRKFDYQKDLNSPNSSFGGPNVWKTMGSPESVKEIQPSLSAHSVIDDALRIAALKFIKNEVKDKETTQKEVTPISAEIFGSNKIKTPNFFLPRPNEDNYPESTTPCPSSPGEDNNTKVDSSSNNKETNVWSEEDNESRNTSKPVARSVIKSRKRKPKFKRKRRIHDSSSEQNRPLARDLKRSAENLSDENESSTRETDNKRHKVSEGCAKGKVSSVIPKRRGRPPLSSKLKALKSVKHRGRPPLIGAIKAKLQKRAVKSRRAYEKSKLVSAQPKIPKRRGRPRKNPISPTVLKSQTEVPKLTDEELLKVKLKIPRKRGRPSKAEAMLREMAVAHLAASEKANTDAGKVNIGLGLTIRPRPARKQSSASRHHRHPQQASSSEDLEQPGAAKKIKLEPVSSEDSTSGGDVAASANDLGKDVKVETDTDISDSSLAHAASSSSSFDKGQRKRRPFKKYIKNDPDYVNNRRKYGFNRVRDEDTATADNATQESTAEDENEEVPANRSRPLLLRNVKKHSKPIQTFTDSEESDVEESTDVEYKTPPPKQRLMIAKVKPPIKICRPVNPPLTGQIMPPIYNVPRVLLPPSIKDTGIPCKMCGKVHTQDHFFKYMELKSTDQPHRCPLCGQYFTWSCLFIEHMRSHPENTAQYRCEYCNAVSRKISAYFNCRITHSPPSKEWLELQKTCDEYLASLNEAKEKKNPRYNRMITHRFVRPFGGNTSSSTVSKNYVMNMNAAKDKTARFPKITPNKVIKAEASGTTTTTEAKNDMVNLNEAKDKKTARCATKMTLNKVVNAEVSGATTAAEIKEVQDKSPMTSGRTKSRASGRKNATSRKPYECKVCRKTFLTFDFLTKHKQLHKSKRPYTCKKCGKRFATRAYFTVHKRTYHTDMEKSFACEVCGLIFSYILAYTNHVNRLAHLSHEEHRKHSLQPHLCDICQRGFKIKQSLINHMRTHTGERPFICEVCNKGFTQTGSLDRHRRIHQRDTTTTTSSSSSSSREKPPRRQEKYRCRPCRKTFTYEMAYQNHMQSHEEDKFFCDFCEQTFATAHLLKTHKHNEQRPFKCKNCGRCYKLKQSLTEHKRVCS